MPEVIRALALVAILAVACGGAAPAAAPAPTATTTAASPARSAGAATRIEGAVQTATSTRLVLADGTTLEITPSTRVTRTDRATPADLKTGLFVAITAKPQPDGGLLASMVSIFSESLSRAVPPGQRPLAEGNLMTNAAIAAIDQVSGTSFTVTFAGSTAKIVLAPDAVILKQVDVRPEEVRAGTRIVATVSGGAAQSIQIQSQ